MPTLEPSRDPPIACRDRGSGPPLVLLHGWSLGAAVFDGMPEAITEGRRVVAPELRGHGASPASGPFTLGDLAGDLARLLEDLDLRGASLLGWSLGAQVALAALPRIRPRVARLALVSATPCFTVRDDWPHGVPGRAVESLALRVRRDAPRAAARFFDGMFAEGELDGEARARATGIRGAIPAPEPAAALAGLEILATADLRPALGAVDLPVLVIHGERDPVCPPGAGRALAAAIPGARLRELPGAGHAPFLSRPEAFAAALRPFLTGRS